MISRNILFLIPFAVCLAACEKGASVHFLFIEDLTHLAWPSPFANNDFAVPTDVNDMVWTFFQKHIPASGD